MPSKRWKHRLVVAGGILLVAVAIIYSSAGRQNWPARFQSNGERIYFTATSSSGIPIVSTGGGMHMQMRRAGCATCHGVDRQGNRLMPRFWIAAPPLTPVALLGEHEEGSRDDGHGGHDSYNDAALRRAITQGFDPDGKQLNPAMPRWTMSEQDLADLTEFLKSPAAD